ncbi:MAG: DNA repair protein RecN [Idiomarina sp.]|uniref:DNA repair protein RecN n=1 Tax=Idiomarina sp. TaxID=1874361 RepID=UPI000C615B69|nr:DNA repair protein RecN [Idiomarina sp.]MBT41909.1 DNA repair protein RecN [Idiomarina sp.]
MLTELHIRHFAIVKSLDIEFRNGMTAITGETGAGKSIALDALSLCLGSRADASLVRPGCDKAEITACFAVAKDSPAARWLAEQDLDAEDECVLRRIINKDGRSKAWINGSPVPLAQQKSLAPLLVNIHGQHEHQLLTRDEHQLHLLDQFARHNHLLEATKAHYRQWADTEKQYRQQQQAKADREAQRQLLEYQVGELDEFALAEGEFEQLEADHKRLSNHRSLDEASLFALNALYEGEHNNANGLVQSAAQRLQEAVDMDPQLGSINELLQQAMVHIEEAALELRHYQDQMHIDSAELETIEQRMTQALKLAKKHQCSAAELYPLHQQLKSELQTLIATDEASEQLAEQRQTLRQAYREQAKKLFDSRQRAANQLSDKITSAMQQLNMPHGRFEISVDHDNQAPATAKGTDQVQFLVSANPGQPLQPISKVASGGELSRISLAIQVMSATQQTVPTMMFDEVDVGVSGPTAAVVGSMLRELGGQCQIICVTHLPQVAAKAHQQLQVAKHTDGKETQTDVRALNNDERVVELARLLGGDKVTDLTKANAKELLAS